MTVSELQNVLILQ